MKYRKLGKTGWEISEIGFGTWAIGGSWGKTDDKKSMAALHKAVDMGVNFFDTADVYGDGHSEKLLAQLCSERSESVYIATKAGRRLDPHTAQGYTRKNIYAFVERSLKYLQKDALDLLQLHCPPTEIYYMPEVFGILDDLVNEGKIFYYGVSVEKVEEALKAIEYPAVQSVQIIFNMFRQRPAGLFFEQVIEKQVGVLARVPLASGLLTGKMKKNTTFESDDHRAFNRYGESFDRGETFSGVDYDTGLQAVADLKAVCPANMTLTQFALRWILMYEAVTTAIPGAKDIFQTEENTLSTNFDPFPDDVMGKIKQIYDKYIRENVQHRW